MQLLNFNDHIGCGANHICFHCKLDQSLELITKIVPAKHSCPSKSKLLTSLVSNGDNDTSHFRLINAASVNQ